MKRREIKRESKKRYERELSRIRWVYYKEVLKKYNEHPRIHYKHLEIAKSLFEIMTLENVGLDREAAFALKLDFEIAYGETYENTLTHVISNVDHLDRHVAPAIFLSMKDKVNSYEIPFISLDYLSKYDTDEDVIFSTYYRYFLFGPIESAYYFFNFTGEVFGFKRKLFKFKNLRLMFYISKLTKYHPGALFFEHSLIKKDGSVFVLDLDYGKSIYESSNKLKLILVHLAVGRYYPSGYYHEDIFEYDVFNTFTSAMWSTIYEIPFIILRSGVPYVTNMLKLSMYYCTDNLRYFT